MAIKRIFKNNFTYQYTPPRVFAIDGHRLSPARGLYL